MRLLIALLLALLPVVCSATESMEVVGAVGASFHEPQLVSVADGAQFFPGQKLSISLAGQVDINREEHSDCNKDWLGQCHRTYWTEHHFRTPAITPAYFELRRVDDPTQKIQFTVGDASVLKEVPLDQLNFDKPYELRAYLAAPGSGIDPSRSSNSYSVTISVDSAARVSNLPAFFKTKRPSASDVVDNRNIVDRYSEAQLASLCASDIRVYALDQFPISGGTTTQESQLALLQYAKRMAPLDLANTKALAGFFDSVGLPAQAEKEFGKAIMSLEQKVGAANLAKDKANLAETLAALATSIAKNSGTSDPGALLRADNFYARAAEVFGSIHFVDRQGTVLASRAGLLRRLKSKADLRASIALYEQAKSSMAHTIVGDLALRSADSKVILTGSDSSGYRILNLRTGSKFSEFFQIGKDFRPVAWDPVSRRVLLSSGDALLWHDPFTPKAETELFASAVGDRFKASAGTVLAIGGMDRHVRVITKTGLDQRLSVGNEEKCQISVPTDAKGTNFSQVEIGYGDAAISLDGKSVGIVCGATIGILAVENDRLRSVVTINSVGQNREPIFVDSLALSPNGRAVAVIAHRPNGGNQLVLWNILEATTRFVAEYPLQQEMVYSETVVTFSPDGTSLIASNGKVIQFVSLETGTSNAVIGASSPAKPGLTGGSMDLTPQGAPTLDVTSPDGLIVKNSMDGTLFHIAWPSQELTRVSMDPRSADALSGIVLTRSTEAGREIDWVQAQQFLSLTQRIDASSATNASLERPITIDRELSSRLPLLLSGGETLVSYDRFTSQILVRNINGDSKFLQVPDARHAVHAIASKKKDSWARVVTAAHSGLVSIDLMLGFNKADEIGLPPVPNSYKKRLIDAIRAEVEAWTKAGKPGLRLGEYRTGNDPADLDRAIAHPDRLRFDWQLMGSGGSAEPLMPDLISLAVFEPLVRYQQDDGTEIVVQNIQDTFALVDLSQTRAANDAVQIVSSPNVYPIAFLSASLALSFSQAPNLPPKLVFQQLPAGEQNDIQSHLADPSTTQTLIAFQAAPESSTFILIGSTTKQAGSVSYWFEQFSVDRTRARTVKCDQCQTFDPSKLKDLVSIEGKEPQPFESYSDVMSGVASSADLQQLMLLSGETLEVIDTVSNKVRLSTNAAIPMLVEGNVAIVRDSKHLLKLYSLGK
jgi:WD40 repeat protein